MKLFLFLFSFLSMSYALNGQNKSLNLALTNQVNERVVDYVAEITSPAFNRLSPGNYVANDGKMVVPVEISLDIYGNQQLIFPVASFEPGETKKIKIEQGNAVHYPKRTYAELSHKIGGELNAAGERRKKDDTDFSWVKPNYMKVSGNFKDHAYYIKYEGPGWESDMVAFRFYLDQRNAVDVFGKKTPGIVLPQVGMNNYEDYHIPKSDWGVDQMVVGNSLGIGSIAFWDGKKAIRVEKRDSVECYIPTDGKVRSQVMTTYYGWNYNGNKCTLKSLISIDAGSRASHMELFTNEKVSNLATGIIKMKDTELMISNDKNSEWSYIATWGKQSIKDQYQDNHMMGLAIFVRTKQIQEITSDDLNQVVVLTPKNGYVDYYFMPTWEFDWKPVVTKADFQHCIDEVLARLNKPILIK